MVAEAVSVRPLPAADPYAGDPVFDLHRGGKIEVTSSIRVSDADELSMAYTPGVARVCTAIAEDPSLVRHVHLEVQRGRGRHRRHRRTGAR